MNIGNLIAKIGVDARDLDKGLGDATRKFKTFGKETKRLGASLTAGVTAPIVAIGASSFNVAAEFEASMAKVQAVSGATASQFKSLENEALRLGSSTSFTASEVSGLQLEFAKLGFTSDEINKVTGATLNLAKASGSDLARSAEVAGSTLRGFGMDASETGHVTDVMAAAFSTSALDMESFAEAMKYVAPVASSAGMDIETVTGQLAALANSGVKGSQAGTALRRIISELGSEGGSVTEKIKKLADEGITMGSAMDEVGRNAQSALLILGENTEQSAALTEQYRNADGAASDMAATMDATAKGGLARMQSAIEGAQISIGSALAPVIMKVAGFVEGLANKFTNLSDGTKQTILVMAGVAAAIGPLLMILPQLVSVAGVVGPALGTAFTAMTGPVGIAIAAVAALTAAFFYFWDDIKGPLTNAINAVIGLYNESEGLRIGVAIFKQAFVAAFTIVKQQVENVISSFSLLFEAIKTAFTDGFSAAGKVLTDGFKDIVDDTKQAGQDVYEGFKGAIDDAKTKDPIELITTDDLDAGLDKFKSLMSFGGGGGGGGSSTASTATTSQPTMQELTPRGMETFEPPQGLMIGTAIANDLENSQPAMQAFFNKFRDEVSNSNDFAQAMQQNAQGMGQAFGDAFKLIISGSEDGKEALKEATSASIDAAFQAATAHAIKAAIQSASNAGPFALAAIPAGIALASSLVRGAFGAITGLADGGVVFGETLVNVGEYGGVRSNPEVIAPLDKLQAIMAKSGNGGTVQVQGVLRGKDIFLSQQRTAADMLAVKGY